MNYRQLVDDAMDSSSDHNCLKVTFKSMSELYSQLGVHELHCYCERLKMKMEMSNELKQ